MPEIGVLARNETVSSKGASEMPARSSLLGVDLLRHVLTIAVIYQHMMSRSRYSEGVADALDYWVPLVDGAVACFFMLSGYFSRPGLTGARVIVTARRLLVPYFLFCLVYAVLLAALGKLSAVEAVERTFTFAGVGPQLYFLPYLFAVSVVVTSVIDRIPSGLERPLTGVLILVLFLAYLALPTERSTGPEFRLLALYALAYALGVYRARNAGKPECLAAIVIAGLALILLPWQQREWDLALIVLLVEVALRGSTLIGRTGRLPGSGGIYLLHTPILNYGISVVLLKFGVGEVANVVLALALTYLIALAITLGVIHAMPRLRPYLLE